MRALVLRWLGHPRWPWVVAGLAGVLTAPALAAGLAADDYIHRAMYIGSPGFPSDPFDIFAFIRDGPPRVAELQRVGLPWWSSPDLKLAFWRPVTALTHAADYALWPDAPWLMHFHSIAWYLAIVLVAGVLFRRISTVPMHAGLAVSAYGLSHTHVMPVLFLANRNALVCVFFGLMALILHHRWRQQGNRRAAILAPLSLLIALLSNEGAVAVGAYLLAYACFLDPGSRRARAFSLVPAAVVVLAWRTLY
ncbi:MAG: hypothetical protein ACT4QD_22020 [Acidobacteriota bacterium]